MRSRNLRAIARNQIIAAIERDLAGGESLMKEAWEQCSTNEEQEFMEDECRRVIAAIKNLGQR